MDDRARGESGRARLDDDDYPTPALTSAALVLGLDKMGLKLPPIVLDPCGGEGQLARVVMAIAPGVAVRLTDIAPRREALDLYATLACVDAAIPADLASALRITGARAILSNFPFRRDAYRDIFGACLAMLNGAVDLFAVMQRAQRPLDCAIGSAHTAGEDRFFGLIACPWRSWLCPKQPGQASPKGAYVWQVYTSTPRRPNNHYCVYTVTRDEAESALGRAPGEQRSEEDAA